MPESGEPAVSWPGSVLYVAHGAKLALLWLTVGGRLRHASLAANTGFKSWHAWDTWPSGPLPNTRARMIFAAIR